MLLPILAAAWRKYILRDDFAYDVLPDQVNGTFPVPGPGGARIVTDTYKNTELVTNGVFTTDTTGWTGGNCTIASIVGGQSGNCLEVTTVSGTVQNVSQSGALIVGRSYTITGYVKSGTSGNETFRIGIVNQAFTDFIEYIEGTSSGTWTQYSVTFVATETNNRFVVSKRTATAGTMLFDTVSCKPTQGLVSVSGGKVSFAGGKATAAWDDPGVWWPPISRAVGKILIGTVNPGSGATYRMTGYFSSSAFAPVGNIYFNGATELKIKEGATEITTEAFAASTDYKIAILQRANGYAYFIKGGTFTSWTLLWISSGGSTATVFPGFLSYSAACNGDNFRIPQTLYLPAPLLSDAFTGADGASNDGRLSDGLGHAETTGIGSGGANVPWTGPGVLVNTEHVSNGTFDSDTSWTKDAGVTIGSGVCAFVGVSDGTGLRQGGALAVPLVMGRSYQITFTISSYSAGGVKVFCGSTSVGTNRTANGTYTETLVCSGDTTLRIYAAASGFTGSIDNVSVKSQAVSKLKVVPTEGTERVTNGTFTTDTTGWTNNNFDTFEVVDGALHLVEGSAQWSSIVQSGVFLSGGWHLISITGVKNSGTNIGFQDGATFIGSMSVSGTITRTYRSLSGSYLQLSNAAQLAMDWNLDNISVKPLTLSTLFNTAPFSTADVRMMARLFNYNAGTQYGVAVRLDSANNPQNFIIAYFDGAGNIKVEKCVAGTYTTLATVATTFVADKDLIIRANGSAIRVYYNDTLIGSKLTVSDAGILNNTRHGLFSTSDLNRFTAATVRAVGTGGEYSFLDNFIG